MEQTADKLHLHCVSREHLTFHQSRLRFQMLWMQTRTFPTNACKVRKAKECLNQPRRRHHHKRRFHSLASWQTGCKLYGCTRYQVCMAARFVLPLARHAGALPLAPAAMDQVVSQIAFLNKLSVLSIAFRRLVGGHQQMTASQDLVHGRNWGAA